MEATVRKEKWHVDRGIPLALIFAALTQLIVIVWGAASISARTAQLEGGQTQLYLAQKEAALIATAQTERVIRVEEKLNALTVSVSELKTIIQQQQPAAVVKR